MKGKSQQKTQRRTAGLPIRASLEPRLDPAGNPASEIFRAVREDEAKNNSQSSINEPLTALNLKEDSNQSKNIRSESEKTNYSASSAQSVSNPANDVALTEPEIVAGNALVSFSNGQMRVVSLQPPKSRKTTKSPRKMLKVITQSPELDKIPALFERTKAEEIYDLLFQLTLGADEPCSSVRVRRSDLMASTNIKTRLTLDANLKRLEDNNLIEIESRPGEQEGNIYTVFPLPSGHRS